MGTGPARAPAPISLSHLDTAPPIKFQTTITTNGNNNLFTSIRHPSPYSIT